MRKQCDVPIYADVFGLQALEVAFDKANRHKNTFIRRSNLPLINRAAEFPGKIFLSGAAQL